jgi:hypothetical protein
MFHILQVSMDGEWNYQNKIQAQEVVVGTVIGSVTQQQNVMSVANQDTLHAIATV